MTTAIIIVDHGSRLAESNALLESVAKAFANRFANQYPIVEPAHMELAPPSIPDAYATCVARGATHILIAPYFLGPGKHWTNDIPNLTAQAAKQFPHTTHAVAPCLGLDDLMLDLLAKRIAESKSQ
jgi:sirohydrochlorin ferrochelatase